jgi:hypothetical protein
MEPKYTTVEEASAQVAFLTETLRCIPADFTFKCDDGDVACRSAIIQKECPLLYSLMGARPILADRLLYLCGKSAAAVTAFVAYLEYRQVPTLTKMPFCIRLAQLADEFNVQALLTMIREKIHRWARDPRYAGLVYTKCKDVEALRAEANTAFVFIIDATSGRIREWYCTKCKGSLLTSNPSPRCSRNAPISTRTPLPVASARAVPARAYSRCGSKMELRGPARLVSTDISDETRVAIFNAIHGSPQTNMPAK